MEERDPVLERNFIIFMILSIIVIFGWMYFLGKKAPPPKKPAQKPALEKKLAKKPAPAKQKKPAQISAEKIKEAVGKQIPEKEVEVESPLYKIVFTNKGAVPVSWKLLNYKDRVYFPYEISLRWPPFKRVPKFRPKPVDLIPAQLKSKPPLRTKIILNGSELGENLIWKVDADKIKVFDDKKTLVFYVQLSDKIRLEKVYTFYPDQYRADLEIRYYGIEPDPKKSAVEFELSFIFEPLSRLARINFHGPIIYTGKKLVKVHLKELNKKPHSEKIADWAGFTDSYFLSALLAPKDAPFSALAFYSGPEELLKKKKASKEYSLKITTQPSARILSKKCLAELELYFGPKEKESLEKVRASLSGAIDYGIWAPIALPLMYALKFINRITHNWGWSIVILTILLRLAMFPLTQKSQKSMKEFQKLQPEIEKIKKKYPDDRLKQQEEILALQRKYKINPMGGCLPMLIQIPIFFAFYKMLLVSIELRHAPWILWIKDLSSRDPLLILPILMGLSQYAMQKLTPTTADPAQARMMMLFPLFFTFLLLYFPAGLLLYWTVSNIIGIIQQIYINKKTK